MSKNSSTNTPSNSIMEELLASQGTKITALYRGMEVEGKIVAKGDKELTLDLGSKSEGILPTRELSEAQKDLKIGDKIKVYVVLIENEYGQVVLSTSLLQTKAISHRGRGINWDKFIQAQNQKSKLRGKVLEINKGGLIVEVEGVRGFLPNSQVGFELISKNTMDNLVGQELTVTVIEVDRSNNKLIFTQRGQVSDEIKNKLKSFTAGQEIKGKIVGILPFGLVVDCQGVEGLVFISDVSWDKVEDLSKMFKIGQELEVKVLGADEDLGRLNLSIKQLQEDPFTKLSEKYPADEVVKGEVISVTEAGVAIKLEDGVEGFLPASKMDPDTIYQEGKSLTLLVDSIDVARRRINLAPFVTSTAGLIYK